MVLISVLVISFFGSVIGSSSKLARQSCLTVPKSICFQHSDGEILLQGPQLSADDPSLIGFYSFDYSLSIDESGHGNDMERGENWKVGPGFRRSSSSAWFDLHSNFGIIEGKSGSFLTSSSSFLISVWVYLLTDSRGKWRTIFSKGSGESMTPSLLLEPNRRNLSVKVSTTDGFSRGITSRGILPLKRWTNIGVSIEGSVVRLFFNGILDSELVLDGSLVENDGKFYLGGDPWHENFTGYIDDLRVYDFSNFNGGMDYSGLVELGGGSRGSISSVGGVDNDDMVSGFSLAKMATIVSISNQHSTSTSLLLGCNDMERGDENGILSCSFDEAKNKCESHDSHICSSTDLYSGILMAGKNAGLLSTFVASDIWYRENSGQIGNGLEKKLALCCS